MAPIFTEQNPICYLVIFCWNILKAIFTGILNIIFYFFYGIYNCCSFFINEIFGDDDDLQNITVQPYNRPYKASPYMNKDFTHSTRNNYNFNHQQKEHYNDDKYLYKNHKCPKQKYSNFTSDKNKPFFKSQVIYKQSSNNNNYNSQPKTFLRSRLFPTNNNSQEEPNSKFISSFLHSNTLPKRTKHQNKSLHSHTLSPSSQSTHHPLSNDDKRRQQIGRETLEVINTGQYTIIDRNTHKKKIIDIKAKIDWCIDHTETIKPLQPLPIIRQPFSTVCRVDVTTESSFEALHRIKTKLLIKETCVLNFASATKPGGGFLNGRGAQEETLSRQSALYSSIVTQEEMYKFNNEHENPFFSDYMIYSPNVPFFRDDSYRFIEPFRSSVITSPAVNFGQLNCYQLKEKAFVVMKKRCERILRLCISKGNRALVIGAFGCGVFKNPPEMVSKIFKELLFDDGYAQFLNYVVFPIYSKSGSDGYLFKIFRNNLQNN